MTSSRPNKYAFKIANFKINLSLFCFNFMQLYVLLWCFKVAEYWLFIAKNVVLDVVHQMDQKYFKMVILLKYEYVFEIRLSIFIELKKHLLRFATLCVYEVPLLQKLLLWLYKNCLDSPPSALLPPEGRHTFGGESRQFCDLSLHFKQ